MKQKKESGITLIALIVMIVIVVILGAVTIRGLTRKPQSSRYNSRRSKRLEDSIIQRTNRTNSTQSNNSTLSPRRNS